MDNAARKGSLEIVQWLHTHRTEGCTTGAMDGAAMNGHLEVLQWLHANRHEGCTASALHCAAVNGHAGVVRWLDENIAVGNRRRAFASARRYDKRGRGCSATRRSRDAHHGHFEPIAGEAGAHLVFAANTGRPRRGERRVVRAPGGAAVPILQRHGVQERPLSSGASSDRDGARAHGCGAVAFRVYNCGVRCSDFNVYLALHFKCTKCTFSTKYQSDGKVAVRGVGPLAPPWRRCSRDLRRGRRYGVLQLVFRAAEHGKLVREQQQISDGITGLSGELGVVTAEQWEHDTACKRTCWLPPQKTVIPFFGPTSLRGGDASTQLRVAAACSAARRRDYGVHQVDGGDNHRGF
ncbi:hypothetical protein ON010_g14656 [Phytophthora cinnamomi]|nr:hypothetical protein ON010_g14656 [Phytophthora cinnamomi]